MCFSSVLSPQLSVYHLTPGPFKDGEESHNAHQHFSAIAILRVKPHHLPKNLVLMIFHLQRKLSAWLFYFVMQKWTRMLSFLYFKICFMWLWCLTWPNVSWQHFKGEKIRNKKILSLFSKYVWERENAKQKLFMWISRPAGLRSSSYANMSFLEGKRDSWKNQLSSLVKFDTCS